MKIVVKSRKTALLFIDLPVDDSRYNEYIHFVSKRPGGGVTKTRGDRSARALTQRDAYISILEAAEALQRQVAELLRPSDLSLPQYNVLRILRGAGDRGMPTLVIRDRMIHEAPGITRLIDRLEQTGLVRRERREADRRLVICYITPEGDALLSDLDTEVAEADNAAVYMLKPEEQRLLTTLLDAVRSGHAKAANG